jgi:hypothetical protein
MSDHSHTLEQPAYQAPSNVRTLALAFVVIGLAALGYGIATDPARGWGGGLIGAYYALSLAIGGAVIVTLMNVTKAGWGVVVRRVPEAMTGYMPVALVAMAAVCWLGMHHLYEWSDLDIVAHDDLLRRKASYLNPGAFMVRLVVILAGWSAITWMIRRNSTQQDTDGDVKHTHRNLVWSVLFLIFFGLTMTFAALDWLMSLEPHWFSTMFGVYHFAGAHVSGAAMVTLLVLTLKKQGQLPHVNDNHLHDLGKMLFAFSTFWAYIWLGQYLLIWYSNIPEETGYFLLRSEHGWFPLLMFNVVVNFAIPFFTLIPRPNKRNPKILAAVAVIILCGHFLDLYLQVVPPVQHFAAHGAHGHGEAHFGPTLPLVEVGGTLLFVGVFLLVTLRTLGRNSLLPKNDPYLQESVHHHQ